MKRAVLLGMAAVGIGAIGMSTALGLKASLVLVAVTLMVGLLALPNWLLPTIAFLVPLDLPFGTAGGVQIDAIRIGALLAVLALMIHPSLRRRPEHGRLALIFGALLALWIALSALGAAEPHAAISGLITYLSAYAIAVIVITVNPRLRYRMITAMLVGAATAALLAMYQYLTRDNATAVIFSPWLTNQTLDVLGPGGAFRSFGSFGQPNALGNAMVIAIATMNVVSDKQKWGAIPIWSLASLLLLGIAASVSRASMVVAAVVILFAVIGTDRWIRPGMGIVLVAGMFMVSAHNILRTISTALASIFTDYNSNTTHWYIALNVLKYMALTHPLMGFGFQNFQYVVSKYFSLPELYRGTHDVYLSALVEMGIPGLLWLLGLYLAPLTARSRMSEKVLVLAIMAIGVTDQMFLYDPRVMTMGMIGLAYVAGGGFDVASWSERIRARRAESRNRTGAPASPGRVESETGCAPCSVYPPGDEGIKDLR